MVVEVAIIINEQKQINDSMFMYEQRVKSPLARLIDHTPTFVDYYHIDNEESTLDAGYKDAFSIIGRRSPIRYKKISNLPLYGINPVVLQLEETDQGLDTSFEDEAVVVPGTIKPLENDFFIIPTLNDSFVFRVNSISYDSIMSDNYYKIGYKFDELSSTKLENLGEQVIQEYTCILENIGTDKRCIIESDVKLTLDKIDEMYSDMCNTYISLFYNDRHNVFLGESGPNQYLYDPYQTAFINKHQLFNRKKDYQTLLLTEQVTDNRSRIKYEKSVYRFIERKDYRLVNNFNYVIYPSFEKKETSFAQWFERNIYILDIPSQYQALQEFALFSDEFVTCIKMNGEADSEFARIIQRFVRNEKITLKEIPLDLNEELIHLNANLEVFFFTPIILYIIKTIVNENIAN